MIERSNVAILTQKQTNSRLQGIIICQLYLLEANTPVGVWIPVQRAILNIPILKKCPKNSGTQPQSLSTS